MEAMLWWTMVVAYGNHEIENLARLIWYQSAQELERVSAYIGQE